MAMHGVVHLCTHYASYESKLALKSWQNEEGCAVYVIIIDFKACKLEVVISEWRLVTKY